MPICRARVLVRIRFRRRDIVTRSEDAVFRYFLDHPCTLSPKSPIIEPLKEP